MALLFLVSILCASCKLWLASCFRIRPEHTQNQKRKFHHNLEAQLCEGDNSSEACSRGPEEFLLDGQRVDSQRIEGLDNLAKAFANPAFLRKLKQAHNTKVWLENKPYPPLRGVTPASHYLLQLAALSMNINSFEAQGAANVEAAEGFDFLVEVAKRRGFIEKDECTLDPNTGYKEGWMRHENGGPDRIILYVNRRARWGAIVFSGTSNHGNMLSNVSIKLLEAKRLEGQVAGDDARWHEGLALEWERLATNEKVKGFLKTLDDLANKGFTVWATGHSLGGMLATVCAYVRNYNLASFGAAVVGTDGRADSKGREGPIVVTGRQSFLHGAQTWRFVHEYKGWVDFVSWIGYALVPLSRVSTLKPILHPQVEGHRGGVIKLSSDPRTAKGDIGFSFELMRRDNLNRHRAHVWPGPDHTWSPSLIAHLLTGYMHSMNFFVDALEAAVQRRREAEAAAAPPQAPASKL